MTAEVVSRKLLDLQLCVPSGWTDEQVLAFAEVANPSGVESGWSIRRTGDELLAGAPERVPCAQRADHVHLVLEVLRREFDELVDRVSGSAP